MTDPYGSAIPHVYHGPSSGDIAVCIVDDAIAEVRLQADCCAVRIGVHVHSCENIDVCFNGDLFW